MRLDLKIVSNGIVDSRSKAANLIKSGNILVNGEVATKAGQEIKENDKIEIVGQINPYVSKGGLKLEKAIKEFGIDFKNKVVIDIGSSTGGFTDCALKNGAKKVYAIDVGHGQMVESLKNDNRVILMEDTDFRDIQKKMVSDAEMIICDASFISVTKLLPKICELGINMLAILIKPQFECGISIAKKYKGVVLNKEVHKQVLKNVLDEFKTNGYLCEKATFSPITGGDGNIEYIAYFSNDKNDKMLELDAIIDSAFNNFAH